MLSEWFTMCSVQQLDDFLLQYEELLCQHDVCKTNIADALQNQCAAKTLPLAYLLFHEIYYENDIYAFQTFKSNLTYKITFSNITSCKPSEVPYLLTLEKKMYMYAKQY